MNIRQVFIIRWCFGTCPKALYHIDVHLSITGHICSESTTVDVIYSCGRLDVNRNFTSSEIIIGICNIFASIISSDSLGFSALLSILTRIVSSEAATYQILDDNRVTWIFFLDINGNIATNTASCIITAIDILKYSTGNCQSEVTSNICIVRTTTDVFNSILILRIRI